MFVCIIISFSAATNYLFSFFSFPIRSCSLLHLFVPLSFVRLSSLCKIITLHGLRGGVTSDFTNLNKAKLNEFALFKFLISVRDSRVRVRE